MQSTVTSIYQYCTKNWRLLLRYVISGGSGVLANLVVFALLTEYFRFGYIFAAVIGFVAAYLVTFSLHKWWTFTATAKTRTITQSLLYLASALVCLGLTIILLTLMIEGLGLWPLVAQFIALGIVAVLSFLFTAQVTFHADDSRVQEIVLVTRQIFQALATQHRFWLSVLALVLVITASVRLGTLPIAVNSDTLGYAETADFLLGTNTDFNGARYLKPLAPGMIAMLSTTGLDTVSGVLVQSVLFFFLLGLAVYWFGFLLFDSMVAGFVMAVLIVTSFPIVKYGLDFYTETGAWTLYFISLAGMVVWFKTTKTTWLWLVSLTLLLGVLWKEYAVLAGLTLLFLIVFHPRLGATAKVHALLQTTALVCIPWALWQYHVYVAYHYSYLDWLGIGAAPEAYATMYTVPAVLKSLFVLLGIGWLYVVMGMRRSASLSNQVQFFIKIMLLPALGFLLWGYVSSRLFFSLVPFLVIFATAGILMQRKIWVRVGMVVLFAVVSFVLVAVSSVPDIRALIDTFTYGS